MPSIQGSLFHISDWYPTLLTAAGGSHLLERDLDGVSQWEVLSKGAKTNRSDLVYNLKIEPPMGAVRVGSYKLMFARNFTKDNWYDIDSVTLPQPRSPRTAQKIKKLKKYQNLATANRGNRRKLKIKQETRKQKMKDKNVPSNNNVRRRNMRMNQQFLKKKFNIKRAKESRSTIKRKKNRRIKLSQEILKMKMALRLTKDRVLLKDPSYAENIFGITMEDEELEDEFDEEVDGLMEGENDYQKIFDQKWARLQKHLFNIDDDPEERVDLQESHPEILEELRIKVRELYGSFVRADFPPADHKGSPRYFKGVWSSGWC